MKNPRRNKTKLRAIGRDQHELLREEMAARMNTDQGRTKYHRRSFLAETPFAVLNTSMNVVQMLLRGTEKVTAELGWICSAYNIQKIARLLATSRQLAMTNPARTLNPAPPAPAKPWKNPLPAYLGRRTPYRIDSAEVRQKSRSARRRQNMQSPIQPGSDSDLIDGP